ncbi:MAG: HAMP domain-containing histidine kinase, partial [Clostridia bacterium]|nr:HAMP domain-containing histidine kinase [Clostridia bacterium]
GSVLEDNFTDYGEDAPEDGQNPTIICAHTVTLPERGEYLVMLSSSVVPVDSTVETLTVQLQCLTIAMIAMGLILALILSRRLSKPIEQINHSAKYLANGEYDIRFPGKGAREVEELADTLNYAAEELSKVETLRRELIANVSHDLRTPLTMISGYAEVMRDLPGENTPENVQVIIDESNRLTGLVNDMLDLSKLQSGAQTVNAEHYSLTEEIRSVLSRYDKLADYTFRFWCDREVFVLADRLKISQVIYNLVNNAINYTGPEKIVYVRQIVEGGTVRVEVTDTGEGIPEDKLPYIWDRYYKVDKAHRRAQVGTGLGLSIVKKILEMHNGKYGVMSRVGEGSTFWFELPIIM